MAKEWGTTPSRILKLDDDYYGWCVDEAIYLYHNNVAHRLSKIEEHVPDGKLKEKQIEQLSKNMMSQFFDWNIVTAKRVEKEKQLAAESDSITEAAKKPGSFRDPATMVRK